MCSYPRSSNSCSCYRESHLCFLAVQVASCSWENLLACTHLNVKESEFLPWKYLGISPYVSNSLYPLMEKGAALSWNLDIWARTGRSCLEWCMNIGSTRRESNSKSGIPLEPIQLPRVECAGPWLSAKSWQRVKLTSKLVAWFLKKQPNIIFCHCSHHKLLLTNKNTSPTYKKVVHTILSMS